MGTTTAIAWTDHTHNHWHGCSPVSRACRFCYAETETGRWHPGLKLWGKNPQTAFRLLISQHTRNNPYRWNRAAEAAGVPEMAFASSMCDVFDDFDGPIVDHHGRVTDWTLDMLRTDLFRMQEMTPWLMWQDLTKRPENIARMVPQHWLDGGWPPNVWIGTSVEEQRHAADRIMPLLRLDMAPIRFISAEPLVGPLDLRDIRVDGRSVDALTGTSYDMFVDPDVFPGAPGNAYTTTAKIDWVICGGESGNMAKIARMDPAWLAALAAGCADTGTAFFMKQFGHRTAAELGLTGKGHDPAEWPVRYPQAFPPYPMPVAA